MYLSLPALLHQLLGLLHQWPRRKMNRATDLALPPSTPCYLRGRKRQPPPSLRLPPPHLRLCHRQPHHQVCKRTFIVATGKVHIAPYWHQWLALFRGQHAGVNVVIGGRNRSPLKSVKYLPTTQEIQHVQFNLPSFPYFRNNTEIFDSTRGPEILSPPAPSSFVASFMVGIT